MARVRDVAEGALVMLGLETEVSLAHDDDFRKCKRGDGADAVDVSLNERKLLRRLCDALVIVSEKMSGSVELKKANAPLQSESVSIPMTCTVEKASEQIPNVLEKAAHVLNRAWVEGVVADSLTQLETEFFAIDKCVQIEKLRAHLRSGSHVDLLAVFFLLLNIDHGLKARVLRVDAGNEKRIARFLVDLRQELVVDFFCSGQTPGEFVRACNEAWCIS